MYSGAGAYFSETGAAIYSGAGAYFSQQGDTIFSGAAGTEESKETEMFRATGAGPGPLQAFREGSLGTADGFGPLMAFRDGSVGGRGRSEDPGPMTAFRDGSLGGCGCQGTGEYFSANGVGEYFSANGLGEYFSTNGLGAVTDPGTEVPAPAPQPSSMAKTGLIVGGVLLAGVAAYFVFKKK